MVLESVEAVASCFYWKGPADDDYEDAVGEVEIDSWDEVQTADDKQGEEREAVEVHDILFWRYIFQDVYKNVTSMELYNGNNGGYKNGSEILGQIAGNSF